MRKKVTRHERMERSIARREKARKAVAAAKRQAEREAPPIPALDLLGREARVGNTIIVPKKGKYSTKTQGTLHIGKAVRISKKGTITMALLGMDEEWRIIPSFKDFLIIDSKTASHVAKKVLIDS